jgi:hypothetical protein
MANRSKLDVLDQKYKHLSGSRRSVFVYIFRRSEKQKALLSVRKTRIVV